MYSMVGIQRLGFAHTLIVASCVLAQLYPRPASPTPNKLVVVQALIAFRQALLEDSTLIDNCSVSAFVGSKAARASLPLREQALVDKREDCSKELTVFPRIILDSMTGTDVRLVVHATHVGVGSISREEYEGHASPGTFPVFVQHRRFNFTQRGHSVPAGIVKLRDSLSIPSR